MDKKGKPAFEPGGIISGPISSSDDSVRVVLNNSPTRFYLYLDGQWEEVESLEGIDDDQLFMISSGGSEVAMTKRQQKNLFAKIYGK